MKKRISAFLLIICICFQVTAQERLTNLKGVYGANSGPRYLGTVAGKIVFVKTVNDIADIAEIWVTDGTETGTNFLKTCPGLIKDDASTTDVAVKNGVIYFLTFGREYANYPQLWRTDGTQEGTYKVLESVTDNGSESYRPVNLLPAENFFFISLHYSGQTVTKKYNYDFQLLSTYSAALPGVDPDASRWLVPTVFKDQLYVRLPSVYIDNGVGYSVLNKGNYAIEGSLYRAYATNINTYYQEYNPPYIIGVVNAFVNDEMKSYKLKIDNTNRKINALDYVSYNNELYALVTSFENTGEDTGIIELYKLNKETGFELKGTYTNMSLTPWLGPTLSQRGATLTVLGNFVDCRFTAIDLQSFRSETVRTFSKQEKIKQLTNAVYELQASGKDEKTIYNIVSGLETTVQSYVQWQGQIDENRLFAAANLGKGFEPYTFDLNTRKFTLIKDLNTNGININSVIALNKQAVWITTEENGINLYKSDGTKNGTRLLSNISSTIPLLDSYFNSWSIVDGTLLYNVLANWDQAEMYHNFKTINFATNGTNQTLKLFESNGFIDGSSVLKTGDNYYYIYGLKENGVFVLKTVKVYPDGHQEPIKTVVLSNPKYPVADIRSISNLDGNYFNAIVSSDFVLSNTASLIVDAVTGEIVNKNFEKYLATFKKRPYFNGIDENTGHKAIYTHDGLNLIKLFESAGDQDAIVVANLADELIFWESGSLWITDGTPGNIRKIDGFPISPQNIAVRKWKDGYLFHNYFDNTGKWLIYSNGTFKEPSIPAPVVGSGLILVSRKGIVYEDKLYFYAMKDLNINMNRLSVYAFDGNDVALMSDMVDFPKIGSVTIEEDYMGGFWFHGNALPDFSQQSDIFWKPGHDAVRIAQGPAVVRCDTLSGNRIILKVYTNANNSNGRTPYQLFISDGVSPAGMISTQQFIDNGYSANPFTVVGNKFYFGTSTDGVNFEPWETDGTQEGTRMVADLLEGTKGSNPDNFINANGIPVCVALTPDAGRQLFSLQARLAQPLIVVPSTEACKGDTIFLSAPSGYDSYKWIINETKEVTGTENKLAVTEDGNYRLIVSKGNITSEVSNAVDIQFRPLPAKPVITQTDNQLTTSATGTVQWYLNGSLITGATTRTLNYTGAGEYTLKVTENGCSAVSDKFLIAITATEQELVAEVYPNPASNKLIVRGYAGKPIPMTLTDIQGRAVWQKTLHDGENEIDVSRFQRGIYFLKSGRTTKKIIIE